MVGSNFCVYCVPFIFLAWCDVVCHRVSYLVFVCAHFDYAYGKLRLETAQWLNPPSQWNQVSLWRCMRRCKQNGQYRFGVLQRSWVNLFHWKGTASSIAYANYAACCCSQYLHACARICLRLLYPLHGYHFAMCTTWGLGEVCVDSLHVLEYWIEKVRVRLVICSLSPSLLCMAKP